MIVKVIWQDPVSSTAISGEFPPSLSLLCSHLLLVTHACNKILNSVLSQFFVSNKCQCVPLFTFVLLGFPRRKVAAAFSVRPSTYSDIPLLLFPAYSLPLYSTSLFSSCKWCLQVLGLLWCWSDCSETLRSGTSQVTLGPASPRCHVSWAGTGTKGWN